MAGILERRQLSLQCEGSAWTGSSQRSGYWPWERVYLLGPDRLLQLETILRPGLLIQTCLPFSHWQNPGPLGSFFSPFFPTGRQSLGAVIPPFFIPAPPPTSASLSLSLSLCNPCCIRFQASLPKYHGTSVIPRYKYSQSHVEGGTELNSLAKHLGSALESEPSFLAFFPSPCFSFLFSPCLPPPLILLRTSCQSQIVHTVFPG